jgi:thioesterase domain-containing protein
MDWIRVLCWPEATAPTGDSGAEQAHAFDSARKNRRLARSWAMRKLALGKKEHHQARVRAALDRHSHGRNHAFRSWRSRPLRLTRVSGICRDQEVYKPLVNFDSSYSLGHWRTFSR